MSAVGASIRGHIPGQWTVSQEASRHYTTFENRLALKAVITLR